MLATHPAKRDGCGDEHYLSTGLPSVMLSLRMPRRTLFRCSISGLDAVYGSLGGLALGAPASIRIGLERTRCFAGAGAASRSNR